MSAIDVDPEFLKQEAESAHHSAEQGWVHIEAEYDGKIPELMETLTAQGPYGYTIMPQVLPDGSIKMPIQTTFEGIREAYTMIRGASDLLGSEPLAEIRGSWYLFTEALNRGRRKGEDEVREMGTVALFPCSSGKGITGELVWVNMPRSMLGSAPAPADAKTDPISQRRELLVLHNRYLDALRAADVDAILDTCNDQVNAVVRNYVNDNGAIDSIDGKEAHREYFHALFEKYEVLSVSFLDRLIQEWYVFAEVRMTLRERASGKTVAFHTAEFFIPGNDGRFIVRVGHGTDPQ